MSNHRCAIATVVVVAAMLSGCGKREAPSAAPPPVERGNGGSPAPAIEAPAVLPKPGSTGHERPAHERARPQQDVPATGDPAVISAPLPGTGLVDVPTTMKQGREAIAKLIVSPGDLATLLAQTGLKAPDVGPGSVEKDIHLTPRMRASLLAPGIDIAPKEAQEQDVKTGEPTEWIWTLVPGRAGPATLVFTLEGIVTIDGKETVIRPPALTKDVRIEVNSFLFVENEWKWLMTAIFIPLVAFFGKRWFDRRQAKPTAS